MTLARSSREARHRKPSRTARGLALILSRRELRIIGERTLTRAARRANPHPLVEVRLEEEGEPVRQHGIQRIGNVAERAGRQVCRRLELRLCCGHDLSPFPVLRVDSACERPRRYAPNL